MQESGFALKSVGSPDTYSDDPTEAVVRYSARMLQLLLWSSALRTLRLGIAEAGRVPEISSGLHEALVEAPTARLATYVASHWDVDDATARARAQTLIGCALQPELLRGLLGARTEITERPDATALDADTDLDALRVTAEKLLGPPR